MYLSRKFPGQYAGTTVLDGGGASSSSAGNIGGTDSTAVGVKDDNPPKIDSGSLSPTPEEIKALSMTVFMALALFGTTPK